VVQKFYRALVPGGMLVLHLPAFECLRRGHDVVVATKRRYTRAQVRRLLAGNGFALRHCCYRLPWLFVAALVQKWAERRHAGRVEQQSDLRRVAPWLNSVLLGLVRGENVIVRRGISMPFGSSVLGVAVKPAAGAP